jgi:hypothetical protein
VTTAAISGTATAANPISISRTIDLGRRISR